MMPFPPWSSTSIWRIWITAATCFWPLTSAVLKSTVTGLTPTSKEAVWRPPTRCSTWVSSGAMSGSNTPSNCSILLSILPSLTTMCSIGKGRLGRGMKPNSTSCGASGSNTMPWASSSAARSGPRSRSCLASVTTTPSSGCPRPRARMCSSSSWTPLHAPSNHTPVISHRAAPIVSTPRWTSRWRGLVPYYRRRMTSLSFVPWCPVVLLPSPTTSSPMTRSPG